MKKLLIILITLIPLYTQWIDPKDVKKAKEVWSEPVFLDSLFAEYYRTESAPTLSSQLDTIFYCTGGINFSYKINGKWQSPVKLINDGTIRGTSISKNGKRLYINAWGGYGGWDMWAMDWDEENQKWKTPKNMGGEINSAGGEYDIYEVNEDTLYLVSDLKGYRTTGGYYKNKQIDKWERYEEFADHPLEYWGEIHGLSLTEDRNKLYFAYRIIKNPGETEYSGLDLFVSYKNKETKKWGEPYSLNINRKSILVDTTNNLSLGGVDYYPWISPDGKTLVFSSNRDKATDTLAWREYNSNTNIYVSYLLIDENGDSLTSIKEEKRLPNNINVQQNYPNPFNSQTKIKYSINKESKIVINLYDSIGRKIEELYSGIKGAGEYELNYDAGRKGLSSGVYYLTIISGLESNSIKIIYLK